jgi:hypothetical protein
MAHADQTLVLSGYSAWLVPATIPLATFAQNARKPVFKTPPLNKSKDCGEKHYQELTGSFYQMMCRGQAGWWRRGATTVFRMEQALPRHYSAILKYCAQSLRRVCGG